MTGFAEPAERTGVETRAAKIPAVVLVSGEEFRLPIAGLSVLDRLVVALHRAGAASITLAGVQARTAADVLSRSHALGIPVRVVPDCPAPAGPVLLCHAAVLLSAADARACLERAGRLLAPDGTELPVGVAEESQENIAAALRHAPALRATRPARWIGGPADAQRAEAELWASLTSSSDGLVDRWFNRPIGRQLLSKPLVRTSVTPNAISIASILIGLGAAWLFARGNAPIFAALLFQLSAVVDCVDGDIARIMFRESPLGKWIDLVGDQIVHLAVFAGIALGAHRTGAGPEMLWLGGAAVAGALISFFVVLRGMLRPGKDGGALQRLVDATTNRDFSVLVLLLACLGRTEWFIWLAAFGSHLFWVAALVLQVRGAAGREVAQ